MLRHRLVTASRWLIAVAVIGSLIVSVTLLLFGGAGAVRLVAGVIAGEVGFEQGKKLALACIELVDLFLLATVFYIISLGLWELFIDDRAPVPHWLEIHDLEDLKTKLAGTVAVVLGVTFLGQVVTWDGDRELLGYGLATAAVIASLAWFISGKGGRKAGSGEAGGRAGAPKEPGSDRAGSS